MLTEDDDQLVWLPSTTTGPKARRTFLFIFEAGFLKHKLPALFQILAFLGI
jgi:hypothetical protein